MPTVLVMDNDAKTPAQASPPTVVVAPAELARDIADRQAALLWVDGALGAILVRLDHPSYEDMMGCWVVEVGFGALGASRPIFETLDEAKTWAARLTAARAGPAGL